VFPIWGECLGLELIAMIVSGRDLSLGQYDQSFLSITDARNMSLKLDLLPGNEPFNSSTIVNGTLTNETKWSIDMIRYVVCIHGETSINNLS